MRCARPVPLDPTLRPSAPRPALRAPPRRLLLPACPYLLATHPSHRARRCPWIHNRARAVSQVTLVHGSQHVRRLLRTRWARDILTLAGTLVLANPPGT